MFKTSQDAYTSAQRQSNESQESRETSAELSCDHRSTSATSERCNRNITRYKMYNLQSGRLILTTFLNDGTSTETCINKRRVLIRKEENILLFLRRSNSCRTAFDVRINQQFIDPRCQHEKASLVCISADLWLKFAAKADIWRNWTYWENGLRRYCCRTALRFRTEVLWHHY